MVHWPHDSDAVPPEGYARAAELAGAAQSVTAALAASLTRRDVAAVVAREAHDALGASVCAVYALDEGGETLRLLASRGLDSATEQRRRVLRWDAALPLCDAVRDGQPRWLPDHDALLAAYPDVAGTSVPRERLHASVAVPLRAGGRIQGGVVFSFPDARSWGPAERSFVLTIADQCAQAFERARLHDEVDEYSRRLEILARASDVLAGTLDWDATLRNVIDLALPEMADFGFFDVVEPGGHVRRIARAHDDPEVQAILDQTCWVRSQRTDINLCALSTGHTGHHPDVDDAWLRNAATGPEHLEAMRALGFRSMLTVPLRHGERLLGALTLFYSRSGRRYAASEVLLVEELAHRAAAAVQNARLHRELQEAVRRRDAANRRKDEFLAVLGHELRNPLAPVTTALELMKIKGDGALARERDLIERQVRHLTRLVDDLLDVSRITRGKVSLRRERVGLEQVIARGVEVASPLLEERQQRLRVDVAETTLPVIGDEIRLAQIVSNLLTNASRYSAPGDEIQLRAWAEGEVVVVECVDDGIGIEPDALDRIFEPFVQGGRRPDGPQGGLGLGLALVKTLAELHGGTAEAWSDGPDRGSRFTVRLPRAPIAEAPGEPGTSGAPGEGHVPRRVLLVDDNADAASTLAEIIHMAGHEVRVAHDAPQALALADTFDPEVAVLDLGLPVMDGYELARRLSAVRPAVRLIALTGYGQEEDRVRVLEAGFGAHLVKPVDSATVLASIATVSTS